MDKGLEATRKISSKNSHLHISEKKIHEGIFMFVKQSGKRAEREGTRKRFFGLLC
jgi:hypothetical protein